MGSGDSNLHHWSTHSTLKDPTRKCGSPAESGRSRRLRNELPGCSAVHKDGKPGQFSSQQKTHFHPDPHRTLRCRHTQVELDRSSLPSLQAGAERGLGEMGEKL